MPAEGIGAAGIAEWVEDAGIVDTPHATLLDITQIEERQESILSGIVIIPIQPPDVESAMQKYLYGVGVFPVWLSGLSCFRCQRKQRTTHKNRGKESTGSGGVPG